jgi:hypothetical protein
MNNTRKGQIPPINSRSKNGKFINVTIKTAKFNFLYVDYLPTVSVCYIFMTRVYVELKVFEKIESLFEVIARSFYRHFHEQ